MEIINQTLIVRCFDSWNIETVLRLCREYKELVEQINDKPWACLVDLSEWELATPDMWDEIGKLNEWGNSHNQRFEAVICSMSIQQMLMEESHSVLTNVETKFCDDMKQARAWLKSVGALSAG
ncbi:STAS/SEC14 domain-containing protein [Thalassotalea sp. PLHSN55]|uniref:STAS/SEC14 domain-containing protein n=1 Tax=Thalassotalea sp. PLHSN55 TaxID=3435888 RepID=UPI003F873B51